MNETHLKPNIGQYALIKNDENKILLLERAKSKNWCLPGGRLNEGEDWDVALLRAVKEEVNFECDDPKPFAVNILNDEYQVKYCIYFTLNVSDISTVILSNEHSGFDWFSLDELADLRVEDAKITKVLSDFLKCDY